MEDLSPSNVFAPGVYVRINQESRKKLCVPALVVLVVLVVGVTTVACLVVLVVNCTREPPDNT
ncbi:unnamed protein product, partial [Lampetra planeri]